MSLSEAAKIINGQCLDGHVEFSGVSTDTRTIEKNQLFVALTGEHFDGHEFISQAMQKGAAAVIVSKEIETGLPCVKVADTLSALQMLASDWRQRFDIPLIAVTGSNGKTTVKELIGSILAVEYGDVLITHGNLNNHIGVPLTLLRLNNKHRCAVVEMGMNHAGEISLLTGLVRPGVALVNNAMQAHVEAFDSVEDVARAKAEIFEGLGPHGVAVLNADDANYTLCKKQAGSHRILDFALKAKAQVTAVINQLEDSVELNITTPNGGLKCRLKLLGEHNAMNALAAVTCCSALDVSLASIKQGLEKVKPVKGRLQPMRLDRDMLLLNDSYNANPDSMKAGIDVLAQIPGGKKILVAGDMAELGTQGAQLHEQIGDYARRKNLDAFLSFGPLMLGAAQAFGRNGFNTENLDELIETLTAQIEKQCVILVKGSRSMQMERVVEALAATASRGQD